MGFVMFVAVVASALLLMRNGARRYAASRLVAAVAKEQGLLMTGERKASLEVMESHTWGYRPVGNEKLFALQTGVSRIDLKASRDRGDHPIGRLLITDKALVFEGSSRNDRWTWAQIASIELCIDGFVVARRRGAPVRLKVHRQDPRTCAVLNLMLRRNG